MSKLSVRVISLCLTLLTVIQLVSCNGDIIGDDVSESTSAVLDELIQDETKLVTDIIKEGKTDYVVVYNTGDTVSRVLANDVCELMFEKYGVYPTLRSDSTEYEYEIIIGKANRSMAVLASEQLKDGDDFLIQNSDKSLLLYAESMRGAIGLEIVLRDKLFNNDSSTELSLSASEYYLNSAQSDKSLSMGRQLKLLDNGACSFNIVYEKDSTDASRIAQYLKSSLRKSFGVTLKTKNDEAEEAEYEILLGDVDRKEVREVRSKMGDLYGTIVSRKSRRRHADSLCHQASRWFFEWVGGVAETRKNKLRAFLPSRSPDSLNRYFK